MELLFILENLAGPERFNPAKVSPKTPSRYVVEFDWLRAKP